jgi:hypothetical protein
VQHSHKSGAGLLLFTFLKGPGCTLVEWLMAVHPPAAGHGMNILLIDDSGGIWDGGSKRVREAFNSPHSGGEFTDYVVKNLGFSAVNIYCGSVQVRLNPTAVTGACLASLVEWISRHRGSRVAVTWWERGDWRHELLGQGDFVYRIDRLIRANRAQLHTHAFVVRSASSAALPDAGTLSALLQHLPDTLEAGQQSALLNLIKRAIGNRYVLVEGEPTSQKLVFAEFGADIYVQQLPWNDRRLGQPIDQQPDRQYGRWIHQSYEDAIKTGRPRFEDVDAIVDWSNEGRKRLRYRRILVPFRTSAGRSRVLAGSIKDDRIDLRVGEVGEGRKIG